MPASCVASVQVTLGDDASCFESEGDVTIYLGSGIGLHVPEDREAGLMAIHALQRATAKAEMEVYKRERGLNPLGREY